MQLKELLLRFNVSHFVFYCVSLVLCVLIGLRLDNFINTHYSIIFTPLWMWNVVVLCGMIIGVIRWYKSNEQRQDEQLIYQYKAMIVSVLLQLLILITEILVVINIDVDNIAIPWSAVFCPLYLLMFISIPSCIWGCYRKQGIEIELLSMCTFVQFIILGIQLDHIIDWNWAIVLIPFWLLYISFIVVLIIIGIVTICSYTIGDNQQSNDDRKLPDVIFFVCCIFFSLFIIIFMCLLVIRLNNTITLQYSIVFVPLYLSLLMLIGTTFSRKPANVWWFGIRKNTVDCILDCCPLLSEYANVSYRKETLNRNNNQNTKRLVKLKNSIYIDNTEYCYEDIYIPD